MQHKSKIVHNTAGIYNEISSKATFETHANENSIQWEDKPKNSGSDTVQWSSSNGWTVTFNCMLPHVTQVIEIKMEKPHNVLKKMGYYRFYSLKVAISLRNRIKPN